MSTQRNRQGSVSLACACGRFAMAATARLYRGCSVIAGLVLMLSCGDSNAGDYNWTNTAGGAFTNSANWSPIGVPGAGDQVIFAINYTYPITFPVSYTNNWAQFNAGNVTLDIGAGNTWYVNTEFRGAWIAGTSLVTMKSGNLSVANNLCSIGSVGNCTMTISNGLAQLKNVYVGNSSGSVGNWNIAGGTNTLSSYLYLGNSTGSTGTVSMTGGSLNVPSDKTLIANKGKGTMTISNGVAQFNAVYVGWDSGSVGNWNIAGGTNTLSGVMYAGNIAGSTGTVSMTGGSLSVANADTIIANKGIGAMTISNGVAQFKVVYVGYDNGSVGTWNISDGLVQSSSAVYVGFNSGSRGNLNIAGGTNSFSTTMYVGNSINTTGTVLMTGGSLSVTNNDTIIANKGIGAMTISNGVAKFKIVIVGYDPGSVGNWNIAGGLVQPLSSVYVGNNSGSRGNLNIAGGTNTLSSLMHIGRYAGSTGTVTITGGSLSVLNGDMVVGNSGNGAMTIANGVAQFQNAYVGLGAGSVGRMTVIGTNAVITCNYYEHRTTNTTLSELFCNGGVSPIGCTGEAKLNGVLTLGMNGYMGLLTTDAIPLINAGSFSGGFVTTNRSVFAVSKTTTQLRATLDSSYRSAGGTLVNGGGLSFSATNQGWVAVSTSGMTGPTFDLNLVVLTNNATHTVSDLVSVLKTAGYTATNSVKSGDEWLTLTLPLAAWSNPAFAWDLTGYDPMMAVRTARIGGIPAKGTMICIF